MTNIPVLQKPVNVASVKQISPFRYPGGKTWMVPFVHEYLNNIERPAKFIEPFLGGGSISMSVAHDNLADTVLMYELDADVAAVWDIISSSNGCEASDLCSRILNFNCTETQARSVLNGEVSTQTDRAFRTIVRNRVQRGGILAPGASLIKNGEGGKGIASRWYPETLVKRIKLIQSFSDRLEFVQGNAFAALESYASDVSAFWFVDPPYTAGGKNAGSRLYAQSQLDHEDLFARLSAVAGHVMMTYDDAPEVLSLAQKYGFSVQRIAMKNSHHKTMKEVVLTNDRGRGFSSLNETAA